MALRQMTFDIPEEIADEFTRDVPAEQRSGVITDLILHRRPQSRLTDDEWEAACAVANADPELRRTEVEFDALASDWSTYLENEW